MEYKLYRLNLDTFSTRVNENFRKNGGKEQIFYSMNRDIEKMLSVTAEIYDQKQERYKPIECMGKGMRSIYLLSLLETCKETRKGEPSLILMENPDLLSDFNSRRSVRCIRERMDIPESVRRQISARCWIIWGIQPGI